MKVFVWINFLTFFISYDMVIFSFHIFKDTFLIFSFNDAAHLLDKTIRIKIKL